MTPSQLIADTYAYFREHGEWPLVRSIQASYGPRISVRAIAAEIGQDKLLCQSGADGRCELTIKGLKEAPEASDDLEKLVTAISFLAECFERNGSVPVSHIDIGIALGISGKDLVRVGRLLLLTSRLWSSASHSMDNREFSFTPSEDAYFFREIKSFTEFESVRARIEQDDRRIGQLLTNEYRSAHGEPLSLQADSAASRYQLIDPHLDTLLQNDLAELAQVRSIGAWKSTAVLAGSCLEALLCDICKQHNEICVDKWGDDWSSKRSVTDLTKLAMQNEWISQDHGNLSGVLTRWRNIVHPNAALKAKEPTKELADVLVSLLHLLVAELGSQATKSNVGE